MSDIGIARKQRIFAVLETTKGTLEFPAATDFIRPAGNGVMNQVPEFSESDELADTLDSLDTFQNAMPAGEWSLPMYCRPSGTVGNVPQGDALFQSFQGKKNGAASGDLSDTGGIDDTVDTFSIDGLTGDEWPERGVVEIDTELIYYGSVSGTTTLTFADCVRGYAGTTPASHSEEAAVDLKSVYYRQLTTSPSFSLWIETDHFVQAMAGCSVTSLSLGVNNEGAVTLNFSGQGMTMIWAGTDALDGAAAGEQNDIVVADAKRYKVGAYIWNVTAEDDNSGAGYEITAIDYTTETLTLGTALPVGGWSDGDVIKGFLPTASVIGTPVESRHTAVEIDGVAGKFRANDWTFNVPKQYLRDEVGTEHPEDYLEDKRDLSSTLNVYFRKEDGKYFYDGYQGNEVPIELVFGNTGGSKMAIYMKRCRLSVPTVAFETPAVALNMSIRVLGTDGEDSIELRFE
jgi:hypothetical protein